MRRYSAIEATAEPDTAGGAVTGKAVGHRFAEALGRKDFAAVLALLDPAIDFRGLTPGRVWEASGADAVGDDILRRWFEDTDELEEILSIETDIFADRQRVSYRFSGHNADGPFVVEQQAYYTECNGRINWMRVLCSGSRSLRDAGATGP
jgi:hypothetical protein